MTGHAILSRTWRVNHVPGCQPQVCIDPGGAYGEILATVAGFSGHPDTEAVANAISAVPEMIAALEFSAAALGIIDRGLRPHLPAAHEVIVQINAALGKAGALG